MHLKSLTLKGFKSFASATTLRFEPGITCVVGPNGSGKSNVLDALTWVMGEKGAKALRGATMQDVIFAGTSGRPPLGRAEVTLTIDNSDGALPIEYTEVSITRRMFREGATEYEINGDSCRLLDIQELLSDSGIGREMHVVVGQGQLSSILESKPEERRGFIEEAAGVLKHRKRKEKALRKLDAMQANLTRLTDLTSELRRQLKPLGKQAEIARRAQTVQAELRDARLRLVADDLVTARAELARDEQDEAAVRDRRSEVERMLQDAQAEQAQLEEQLAADVPRLTRAQDTWYQLSALDERLRGTVRLAQERLRHLSSASADQRPGRDPEELEAEAERTAELEEQLREEVVEARTRMAETELIRSDLEAEVKAAERAHLAAVRAVSDRREGLARLSGRVDALRGKVGDTTEELGRLSEALEEAVERAELAAAEHAEHESSEDGAALDQRELADRATEAAEARQLARDRVAELVAEERKAEREVASWRARVEALSLGLRRKDGAGALLAAADRVPGLLGSVASLLTVDSGAEVALAAALGPVADAVAMAGREEALEALRLLKEEDAGRAGLLLAGAPPTESAPRPPLPAGASWAADRISGPVSLRPAVERALRDVVVVADLPSARAVLDAVPGLTAVTSEGDVLGGDWASGGSERDQSVIEVQAALDEARREREAAVERVDRATAAVAEAREAEQAARDRVRATQEAVNEARVHRARGGERLNRLRQAASSAQAEVGRLTTQRDKTDQARRDAVRDLEELERRLSSAQGEPAAEEPDTEERDAAARRLAEAREVELDARLAVRTAEERARSVQGKADQLRRAARAEREARARAEAARAARARAAEVARAVARAGESALGRLAVSVNAAAHARDVAQARRAEREEALTAVRNRARELGTVLEKLIDAAHRDEVVRAERRLRIEQLEAKIAEDFGIGLDELVAEYGPTVPVPPSPAELAEFETARERGEQVVAPAPVPYERATQQRRAKRAERDLSLLGRVNPLALEEFAALEERYRFLSTQLEDLKATRRDLLTVVKEVDEKILEVFSTAYTDVAREFEVVFATLFPGGEGRLVLTDPDDLLTTGVDVEARPPGKKVKRLSLLSGGEKSLTAVAMLVAIFRARPSPFYVMDEVEAALDDTNLRRLIGLLEQLRETSQLIIITHQKPTMEIADALYGVSMRGDGITTVISQRLRDATDRAGALAAVAATLDSGGEETGAGTPGE